MIFLAGLPRSGSTVLAAVLNQHPQIAVSSTSPLIDVMGAVAMGWEQSQAVKAQGKELDEAIPLLRSVMATYHAAQSKPIQIDKSRGWAEPQVISTMAKVLGHAPKIIATVRHIPDCAASFVRVAKPENVKDFLRGSALIEHLKSSYVTLQSGFAAHPDCFHFVDYDDLMTDPKRVLGGILDFIGANPHDFDLSAIDGSTVKEDDAAAWGVDGLHDIATTLGKRHDQDSRDVLGSMYQGFCQPEFWRGQQEPVPQPIDMQKEANLRGDFVTGWNIAQVLAEVAPDDDRAAFNRGWHLLHQGDFQGGMELLDRGRAENVFGNPNPGSGQPLWDGQSKGTVLLSLEGGLGDQIHAARFAREIALKGCDVILGCAQELVPLLRQVPGVTACVVRQAGPAVYHDYWVPGMSASRPLGLTWEAISGQPYLPRRQMKNNRPRIGLRWQGNPRFEEQQQRLFPADGFFRALEPFKHQFDFISLQRDEGAEHCPSWVAQVDLSTWEQTAMAVGACDLVISSCTSVAHLAGAMGVKTYTIVPVMPYYLWALPGCNTPWYGNMELVRQSTFGQWDDVFSAINNKLKGLTDDGLCTDRLSLG